MPSAGPDLAQLRFSTHGLREQERIPFWREVFGRYIAKVQFERVPDARFFHTATLRSLPGLGLISSACAGFRAERTFNLGRPGAETRSC